MRRSPPWLEAAAPLALLAAACLAAWRWPGAFTPLRPGIVPGLGVIMFGMGMALAPGAFGAVLRRPARLLLGVALQYTVMPLAALAAGLVTGLPAQALAGLVLTGACPGGTASNVMAYLARANVALSVAMTMTSTLLAPVATPWLSWWLVGERVAVPVWPMFRSILLVVILPLALGMACRRYLPGITRRLAPVFPWLSMSAIALIVAVIVALARPQLVQVAPLLVLAVVLHNGLGLAAGYLGARLAGADAPDCRALALEVGMQNSGLASVLAVKFFSAGAALPAAVFSVWHNASALMLVARWRRRPGL